MQDEYSQISDRALDKLLSVGHEAADLSTFGLWLFLIVSIAIPACVCLSTVAVFGLARLFGVEL